VTEAVVRCDKGVRQGALAGNDTVVYFYEDSNLTVRGFDGQLVSFQRRP